LSRFDISFANIYMVDERGRRAILTETIGNLTKGSSMCPTLVTIPKLVSRSYVSPSLFALRSSFPNAVRTLSRDSSDIGRSEDSGKSEESSKSDSRSSSSEEDEELGGMWCSIFREVLSDKRPQILDLTSFGGEVPPCSAWGEAESDRPRYVFSFATPSPSL
jgi:hypothetical protein